MAGEGGVRFVGNRYWVLRHGKSIPNEMGLIVSSMMVYLAAEMQGPLKVGTIQHSTVRELAEMENGKFEQYKLAPEGIKQAELSGESFLKVLKEDKVPLENVRICYSPFSRTTHTTQVVASVLDISFEGPQCMYPDIWALDEKDPFMQPEGGESVADVVSRLTSALINMESQFRGCTVLVVSHGDPLQIFQTVLNAAKDYKGSCENDLTSRIQAVKIPSVQSQHRRFALQTGELRSVV